MVADDDRKHALLSRHLTGRLGEDEAVEFHEHLKGCDECRAEKAFLEEVQAETERHGGRLFEDHPAPDKLVALQRGELPRDEANELRRHLDLCATCPTEARWISGEAVVGPVPSAGERPARVRWAWPAALAATVLLAVAVHFAVTPAPPAPGLLHVQVLRQVAMAGVGANTVRLAPGEAKWVVFLPVDVPAADFPCRVEIVEGTGKSVFRTSVTSPDDLASGLYVFFECPRSTSTCQPGSYAALIQPAGNEPPERIPFDVVER